MTEEDQLLESHRPFVRDIDRAFSGVYGYGGMSIIGILMLYLGGAFALEALSHVSTWIIGITVLLASLKILSTIIKKRKVVIRTRLEQYCATNEIPTDALRDYFKRDNMYPFFAALLEPPTTTSK